MDRDVTHNVVRDAIAMRLGAKTEVSIGATHDRVDVVVFGGDDEPDLLIEVKPAHQLGQGIGQINSYAARWPKPCKKQLHLFQAGRGLSPAGQRRRVDEHRRSGELDDIQVTIEQGDPASRLGSCYEIAGVKFDLVAPQQSIAAHVASIGNDFLLAEYLAPAHRQFLLELAQAWRHPKSCTGITAIASATPTGQPAMVVLVHGAPLLTPLPVDEAVRSWLRLQHYRWLAAPVFPTAVGVSR